MQSQISSAGPAWSRTVVSTVVAGVFAFAAGIANAAECPADKRVADGQGQKMSAAAAKHIHPTVAELIPTLLGALKPME